MPRRGWHSADVSSERKRHSAFPVLEVTTVESTFFAPLIEESNAKRRFVQGGAKTFA